MTYQINLLKFLIYNATIADGIQKIVNISDEDDPIFIIGK